MARLFQGNLRMVGITTLAVLFAGSAQAEFYAWEDAAGKRRISNIDPTQIKQAGRISLHYHPYSVVAQHERMRAKLARQAEAIAAAQAAQTNTARRPGSTTKLLPFPLKALQQLRAPVPSE